jgi:hypothetical protein
LRSLNRRPGCEILINDFDAPLGPQMPKTVERSVLRDERGMAE